MVDYIGFIKRIAVVAIMMFLYAGNSVVYADTPGDDQLKNSTNAANEAGETGFKKVMNDVKKSGDNLAKKMGYGENGGKDLFFDAVDTGKSIASGENPMDTLDKLKGKYEGAAKAAIANKIKKEKEKKQRKQAAEQKLAEEKQAKENAEKEVDEAKKKTKKKRTSWLKKQYNWVTHNSSAMSGLGSAMNSLSSGDTDGAFNNILEGADNAAVDAYNERKAQQQSQSSGQQ